MMATDGDDKEVVVAVESTTNDPTMTTTATTTASSISVDHDQNMNKIETSNPNDISSSSPASSLSPKNDQVTSSTSSSTDFHSTTSSFPEVVVTTTTTTSNPLSRESSNDRISSNIPRRSRTSDLDITAASQQSGSGGQPTTTSTLPITPAQQLSSADVPTAANSRSFFLNRETQKSSVPSSSIKVESAVPSPPEPTPSTLVFTPDQLASCIRLAVVEAPSASKIDLSRLPQDTQRVISDVISSNNSIFNAIHGKLDGILKLLHAPARVDWKPSRRAIAEQHPICLLDSLVDSIGLILATKGVWCLEDDQPSLLICQMDEIAVLVSDLQRRLTFQNKARANKQQSSSNNNTSPPESPSNSNSQTNQTPLAHGFGKSSVTQNELIETLSRLTSCLSEVLRSNIEISTSRLSHALGSDPLIASITGSNVGGGGSKSNSGSPRASAAGKTLKQVPRLLGVSSSLEQQHHHSKDQVGPFVKTVQTLMQSDLCCRLFESVELRTSLNCLQGIRAGLEELARQRAFEWCSTLSQESLPHHFIPMPHDYLTPDTKKAIGSSKKGKDHHEHLLRNKNNSHPSSSSTTNGCSKVQGLLGVRLIQLSTAFRALYRFVGSILGGVYEDPEIQSELSDASVLGSYVTMVGFLFHSDLNDLAQWMAPVMSQVRRKIKQQTAAVNSISASTPRGPPPSSDNNNNNSAQLSQSANEQASTTAQPRSTHSSAAHLSSLLSAPQDICLTRLSESENILYYFLPHLRKARAEGSQIGAPADRVNRILVWLAWEGGLSSVYETIQKPHQHPNSDEQQKATPLSSPPRSAKKVSTPSPTTTTPSTPPPLNVANAALEDSIVNAIMEGCRIVKEKLTNALQLFSSPLNNGASSLEWNGRGDDVLEFCQRVIESITLRYYGEVDLRNVKDIHAKIVQPKWKSCLLVNLGRATLPSRASQVSTRVCEALPKLFGEYCHQSLFYSCPLQQLGLQDEMQSGASSSAIASSTAATSRLNGVTRDLDLRIIHTQNLAEAAVLNSHQNHKAVENLSSDLKDLTDQFQTQSQGVVDRHSNQIRTHTNRLEEHTTDIRRVQQLITSHQSRLESHTAEIKKFSEAASELKSEALEAQKQIEETSKAQADSIESRVSSVLDNVNTQVDQALRSSFAPHLSAIEKLRLTAEKLEENVGAQQQQSTELLTSVTELTEKLNGYKGALQQFETSTREEQERIRESMITLQEGIKEMMKGVTESVIVKSKGELSSYLTEHLSQCVNNHVTYHLDRVLQQRQQSSSARKKLLSWASSAMANQSSTPNTSSKFINTNAYVNDPKSAAAAAATPLRHQVSSSSMVSNADLLIMKAPSLIQSTHRTSHRCGGMNDDLTSLADTSSVMEESCSMETPLGHSTSWFADVQLLDLPDPRGNGGSASFVVMDHNDNNRLNGHRSTTAGIMGRANTIGAPPSSTPTVDPSVTPWSSRMRSTDVHGNRGDGEADAAGCGAQDTPKPQTKVADD